MVIDYGKSSGWIGPIEMGTFSHRNPTSHAYVPKSRKDLAFHNWFMFINQLTYNNHQSVLDCFKMCNPENYYAYYLVPGESAALFFQSSSSAGFMLKWAMTAKISAQIQLSVQIKTRDSIYYLVFPHTFTNLSKITQGLHPTNNSTMK